MKYINLFVLFFLTISFGIYSNPPYKGRPGYRYEDGKIFCTATQHDNNTRVTVYGDSRMDYAGLFFSHLDDFLLAGQGDWNVQNYGVNGETSDGLLNHLKTCLTPDNTSYKVHQNIVYHIGGNDFIHNYITLRFLPWRYSRVINKAANNNERIVSLFLKKGRNVILSGHYPAITNSFNLGLSKDYLPAFFGKKYDGLYYFDPTINTSYVGNKLQQCLGNESLIISDSDKYKNHMSYFWLTFLDLPTGASIGLMNLEQKIILMQQRRAGYFSKVGLKLEHQPIWRCFQIPGTYTDEPYVVDPNLMSDIIHPNANGLFIWGTKVRQKMDSIGFSQSTFEIGSSSNNNVNLTDDNGEVLADEGGNDDDLLILAACFFLGKCKL
jgi:hypothetical protein